MGFAKATIFLNLYNIMIPKSYKEVIANPQVKEQYLAYKAEYDSQVM